MFANDEATLFGDPVLSFLDGRIEELFDLATLQAHEVVMVMPLVEFEHRLAGLEVMAFEEAGLFELGEHAIHGGQPDVHVFGDQQSIDVFRRQVPILHLLEQVEDLESREGGLEADTFEVLRIAGHGSPENLDAPAESPAGPV